MRLIIACISMLIFLTIETKDVVPEPMLRLQRMIKAGFLAAGATITYTCKSNSKSYEFAAELAADGSLVKAKEVTARRQDASATPAPSDAMIDVSPAKPAPTGTNTGSTSGSSPAKDEETVFSSPTDFALAMYKRTVSRQTQRNKRKPSINGWTDCTVNGKTLVDLLGIMLRERKNAAASSSAQNISKPAQPKEPNPSLDTEKPATGQSEKDNVPVAAKHPVLENDGKDNSDVETSLPNTKPDKLSSKSDLGSASNTNDPSKPKPSTIDVPVPASSKTDGVSAAVSSATKEEAPPSSPAPDPIPTDKVDEEGNDAEESMTRKKSSKSKKTSSKKSKSPSPVPETKKRKRSESGTPQSPSNSGSASMEKATRARSSKSRRRLNMDIGPGIPTDKLDPDTVEAVAVAAAAEKEEAIAARRTTRLAAGKIDKVDYNAASGLPSKPFSNVEPDESDGDIMGIEPATDEPRKSRRREASEREKQRVSRRQAKKRASREQSPGRNGGDGNEGRSSKRGSRSASRNGDSDGAKRGSSVGKDETGEVENAPESRTGTPNSDEDHEEADEFAAVNVSDREDEKGWTISSLSGIASAVRRAESTTPSVVAGNMRKEKLLSNLDLTERDVIDKLNEVIAEIERVHSLCDVSSDNLVREVLAFFATDLRRLSSGHPRPVYTTQRRIARIEKRRVSMEKKKRRAKRELDEVVNKLESEMESRRKTDLDAAFATMNLKELERECQREAESKVKLEKDIKYVKAQERDGRKRFERTKRLYSKLIQTAKDNDTPKVELAPPLNNPDAGPSCKKRSQRPESANTADSNGTIGESVISDETAWRLMEKRSRRGRKTPCRGGVIAARSQAGGGTGAPARARASACTGSRGMSAYLRGGAPEVHGTFGSEKQT